MKNTKTQIKRSWFSISLFLACATANADTVPAELKIFAQLAKKVVPSVVNISTTATVKSRFRKGAPQDLFKKFFGEPFGGKPGPQGGDEEEDGEGTQVGPRSMSLGTGFIIDSTGLILTNNHDIAGADEVKVLFTEDESEKPTSAEIVGRDSELDLALLKVKTTRPLTAIALGNSDQLDVGEYVMAVGNPFGQGHSVTHGIVSAKGRRNPASAFAKYIQTDAPINPGNSGGPLVNLEGEVIGINNAIDARAQGIGFAIPISQVKAVLPQLKEKGSVTRGYIGVGVNDLTPEIAQKLGISESIEAPFVTQIFQGQPAAKAGVKPYDVILELNQKPLKNAGDLISAVSVLPVGQTVPLKVLRGKETLQLSLTVGKRPNSMEDKKLETKLGKKSKAEPKVVIGASLVDITPEIAQDLGLDAKADGVVVEGLDFDSPADHSGLNRGDVIVEVNKKPVKSVEDFYKIVKDRTNYLLRVRRVDEQGQESFSVVVLDLKKAAK